MSEIWTYFDSPVVETWSNVLLHFLWQANLLSENLAAVNEAEQNEVASLIGALKTSRLAEIKLQEALRKPITAKFNGITFEQAIKSIASQLDIDIVLDEDGLSAEGVDKKEKVSLDLRNEVAAKTVLSLLLEPRRLAYRMIDGAGVLQITCESRLAGEVHSRVYNVRDLLGLPFLDQDDDPQTLEALDYPSLMNLITATIEPNMWDEVGGPCAIQSFAPNKSLVVSGTSKIHDEIVELFGELRAVGKTLTTKR